MASILLSLSSLSNAQVQVPRQNALLVGLRRTIPGKEAAFMLASGANREFVLGLVPLTLSQLGEQMAAVLTWAHVRLEL
jgi:hypothetical protein